MKLFSFSLLALIVAAEAASAATVSSSAETSLIDRTTSAPYTGTFSFDKFDLSLGTLTSAILTFSYGYSSVIWLTGPDDGASEATAQSRMQVTLIGGTGSVLGADLPGLISQTSMVSLAPGEETSVSHFDLDMSSPYSLIDLAAITGTDMFGIDYSIITDALITGASGSFETDGKLKATITYTYDVLATVPATPALPLLACALPLLLLWRRRRA